MKKNILLLLISILILVPLLISCAVQQPAMTPEDYSNLKRLDGTKWRFVSFSINGEHFEPNPDGYNWHYLFKLKNDQMAVYQIYDKDTKRAPWVVPVWALKGETKYMGYITLQGRRITFNLTNLESEGIINEDFTKINVTSTYSNGHSDLIYERIY